MLNYVRAFRTLLSVADHFYNRLHRMESESWSPITESEFVALLTKELSAFEPADHNLWAQYHVDLRTAPIFRSAKCGMEQVFVVAALGDYILFFDDVEDEFGVAKLPAQGPLQDYCIFGELRYALRGLANYAK